VPKNAVTKTLAKCLTCSHQWEVNPSNISKGSKCPACAKNSRVPQSTWDERAAALGLQWIDPVSGRHSKAKIKCLNCSHVWICEAGAVARGSGCPKCARVGATAKRRLPTSEWIARAEKLELEWIELPTNNSNKKLIRCKKCTYEWHITPMKISRNSGCPKCAGTLVTEEMWIERAKAVNINWLKIPTNSRIGTPAECNICKLVWKPVPDAVRGGSGCPDCAITGYKYGEPGLLYLVERKSGQGRSARKIGITNVSGSKVRIDLWRRQDFVLLKTVSHRNGQLIYELEQQLLRWLRFDLKLPQYLDKEEMPLGGATETFDPEVPTMAHLEEKIDSIFNQLKSQADR
jgi:predicted Zn-ribbon and HTH transcriptional regulator